MARVVEFEEGQIAMDIDEHWEEGEPTEEEEYEEEVEADTPESSEGSFEDDYYASAVDHDWKHTRHLLLRAPYEQLDMEKVYCPQIPRTETDTWELWCSGASTKKRAGFGFLLKQPTGEIAFSQSQSLRQVSSTQAEYEALLAGLSKALQLNALKLKAHADNEFIVRSLREGAEVPWSQNLQILRDLHIAVLVLAGFFKSFEIEQDSPYEGVEAEAHYLALQAIKC